MEPINELALFAGAGGGILGSHLLGFRVVCAVERDPYCREILLRRQEEGHLPPFPIWDEIRTFDGIAWRGLVDIVTAGFPCQMYSTAARGRNTASCLFEEVLRVVEEVRPMAVLFENVLLRSYPAAIRDLVSKISAADVGAPHQRPRYWLAAHTYHADEPTIAVDAKVAGVSAAARTEWWEENPDRFLGMDDGGPYRVDRFRCLGNGQVPAVVREAWNRTFQGTH